MSDETRREQIMNFIARYLLIFKYNFKQRGGWSSKRNISVILLLLWAFYTWMRERGFLPKKSVRGKHVFITGAGTGLGSLLALRFVELGAKVTVSGLLLKDVNDTKRMIKEKTGADLTVMAVELDVCDRKMITNVIKKATDQFGDVDILINNAGVVQGKAFMDLNENFVSKTLQINAESHFWLIRDVLGPMMQRNSGQIVSIASIAGLAGTAGMTDYCASKFAAYGLNEALRVEMKLLKKNIGFTTICPFYFNSGLFEGAKCSIFFPLLDA